MLASLPQSLPVSGARVSIGLPVLPACCPILVFCLVRRRALERTCLIGSFVASDLVSFRVRSYLHDFAMRQWFWLSARMATSSSLWPVRAWFVLAALRKGDANEVGEALSRQDRDARRRLPFFVHDDSRVVSAQAAALRNRETDLDALDESELRHFGLDAKLLAAHLAPSP